MRWALAVVVVAAITVRLAYLWQVADDLFIQHPVIDDQLNVADARYLRDESWAGPPEPYWKPPLYAYVLAVVGDSWGGRLANVGFDALSCLIVFSLGARLWSPRIGLAAAAILAMNGTLVYFTGQLVSASLVVFLHLAALRLAWWAWDREGAWTWLLAGAAGGVLALARAEGVLLGAGVIAAAALRGSGATRARDAGAVALGLVLAIAPVTIRNATRGGDPVLISANGGINLYIGTVPEYGGVIGVRPCHEWERLVREPEGDGVTALGSAHSSYFVRRALARVAAHPGEAAGHWFGKQVAYWHGHELPSNRDLYGASRSSSVLRALLWRGPPLYAPWGVLAPLAIAGMVLVLRTRHRAWPLVAAVTLLCLSTTLFFVTARFRAPVIPLFALFAAGAGAAAIEGWHSRRRRVLAAATLAVVVLGVAINHPAVGAAARERYRVAMAAEEHHFRGTVLLAEAGQPRAAVPELERAIALEPRCAQTRLNLAQARLAAGDPAGALAEVLAYLDVVDRASPGERAYEGDAIAVAMQALATSPRLAASDAGVGLERLIAGDPDAAIAALTRAAPAADALLARALRTRAAGALLDERPRDALADVERALGRWREDAEAHLLAGLAQAAIGNRAAACLHVTAFHAHEWPRGALARRAHPDDALTLEALALARSCR